MAELALRASRPGVLRTGLARHARPKSRPVAEEPATRVIRPGALYNVQLYIPWDIGTYMTPHD